MNNLSGKLKNELFNQLVNESGDSILLLTNQFCISNFNKAANELFDNKLSIGFKINSLKANPTNEQIINSLAGELSHTEIKNYNWKISHISDDSNSYYLIIGKELIEHKKLKRHSDDLKTYFESVVANMPGHIFWKDRNCVYLGCNDKMAEICGLSSRDEIVGKTDHDLVWGERLSEEFTQDDREVMESGQPKFNILEKHQYGESHNHTMLTNKVPLKDKSGNIIGVLGMAVDITEQKHIEDVLKREKIKAEAASRAKSEFIQNISHDIRTPITGVLGISQAIKDTATEAYLKDDAELLISTTQELLSLLNEVIEIVRLESGDTQTQDDIFSIKDIVDHNVLLHRSAAKHRNIKLTSHISSDVPSYTVGNRVYMDRIILNLLSNAIKFTSNGDVSISVDKVSETGNIVSIQFKIKDTGIGIPENQHNAIFEHFSRLAPSSSGIYKGHGLGLYTVKQYVNSMNGTISLTSEEGKGTTFIVNISFTKPNENHENITAPEFEIHDTNHDTKRPVSIDKSYELNNPVAKVLVVEDQPLAARMVQQLLLKTECTSENAVNGAEALAMVTDCKYDLILMDIGLPDIDGLEVTRRIRNIKLNKLTPIIALTGHMGDDNKKQCIDAGMQDMQSKPVTLFALQKVIDNYVLSNPNVISDDIGSSDGVSNNLAVIDLYDGANLSGGNVDIIRELLITLLSTLPNEIQLLKDLYKSNEIKKMYDLVHKLYGGICYCGVPRLREVSKELKLALHDNNTTQIELLLDFFYSEADKVFLEAKKQGLIRS